MYRENQCILMCLDILFGIFHKRSDENPDWNYFLYFIFSINENIESHACVRVCVCSRVRVRAREPAPLQ